MRGNHSHDDSDKDNTTQVSLVLQGQNQHIKWWHLYEYNSFAHFNHRKHYFYNAIFNQLADILINVNILHFEI